MRERETRRERPDGGARDAVPVEGASPVPVASGACRAGRASRAASPRHDHWAGQHAVDLVLAHAIRRAARHEACQFGLSRVGTSVGAGHAMPVMSLDEAPRTRLTPRTARARTSWAAAAFGGLVRQHADACYLTCPVGHRLTPAQMKVELQDTRDVQCHAQPRCGCAAGEDKYVTLNS